MSKEKTKPAKGGLAAAKAAQKKDKPQSKCAFIDDLLESGKHTLSEILDKTIEAFPKAAKKSTMATIRARPTHMRKAGRTPSWKPEPEEKEKLAA